MQAKETTRSGLKASRILHTIPNRVQNHLFTRAILLKHRALSKILLFPLSRYYCVLRRWHCSFLSWIILSWRSCSLTMTTPNLSGSSARPAAAGPSNAPDPKAKSTSSGRPAAAGLSQAVLNANPVTPPKAMSWPLPWF